jgi:hypothetical protein
MMEGVSTLIPRLLAAAFLAALMLCGRFAVAGTASLEDMLAGALTPSAAAPMLGPITSAGRVGWKCKPERAASSDGWREAELPSDPVSP